MKILAKVIFGLFRPIFKSKRDLILENLALRQQLATQQLKIKRPKLSNIDRLFWIWLSNIWPDWKSALIIVRPETVIKWNRKVFKLYWHWKSRSKPGRPKILKEVREQIKQMCRQNPTWGAPRIHAELRLLGYDIAETTVANYMIKPKRPPSQTWRTFLKNHTKQIVAIDFFTVPTVRFRITQPFLPPSDDKYRIPYEVRIYEKSAVKPKYNRFCGWIGIILGQFSPTV